MHNQCELMTRVCQEFLVQDSYLPAVQKSIPITIRCTQVQKVTQALLPAQGDGEELVACISVARVRPRISKGITDLLQYCPRLPSVSLVT